MRPSRRAVARYWLPTRGYDGVIDPGLFGIFVVVSVGAAIAATYLLRDLALLRREELQERIEADWKPHVVRTAGVPAVPFPSESLLFELGHAPVEVRSPRNDHFDVTGTISERDLSAKLARDGEVLASGSGWDALALSKRREVGAFVKDGGVIAFGRMAMPARGVDAAGVAVRRVAALSISLSSPGTQDTAAILRRVTSADDPGRVSLAGIPDAAGQLSVPREGSVSLAPKNPLTSVTRLLAAHGAGEDRVLAIPHAGFVVVVVADGAGGTGGGAAAAERILARVQQVVPALCSGVYEPAELLAELDRTLAPTGAEAAAVVAIVSPTGVRGACAGDVEAILLTNGVAIDLTAERRRKPLLGHGDVVPVAFAAEGAGRVLIATDGLFGYAKRERIVDALQRGSLDEIPEHLVELARLPNGTLQDDLGLVVCGMS